MSTNKYVSEQKPSISKATAGEKSKQRTQNATTQQLVLTNKSKGDTEDLYCFLYDVGVPNQFELFTSATKKIANFAVRTCNDSQDINISIKTLIGPVFVTPSKVTGGDDVVNTLILTREIDAYIKHKPMYRQNKATIFWLC